MTTTDDRAALIETISRARIAWANDGDGESCPDQAIADALLAAGWTRGGEDAALNALCDARQDGPFVSVSLDDLDAPEILAWALVGDDGEIDPGSVNLWKHHARRAAKPGERVVRVAIRIVDAP